MSLEGRCSVITGGGGYIGSALASVLCSLGSDIVLIDSNPTALRTVANDLMEKWGKEALIVDCDLEIEKERCCLIENLIKECSRIDVLINNAAFVGSASLEGWSVDLMSQSLDTWRRAMEVNLTAAFHLSQGLMPTLKENGTGSIINIGSIYGELGPDWSLYEGTSIGNPAAYGVSKGALFQLTRWLACTVAPDVRVNAISPGGLERGQDKRFVERYSARTPMARMATEEDLLGAVAFLSSDASAYVTGQVLRVDGGWGIW